MHLSVPSRDMTSKGTTAKDSLSSEAGRTDDCDCYCGDWLSRDGSPEQLDCALSRNES